RVRGESARGPRRGRGASCGAGANFRHGAPRDLGRIRPGHRFRRWIGVGAARMTYPFARLPENLAAFCASLRQAWGFRVGPGELLDAAHALLVVDLADEHAVRNALRPILSSTQADALAFDCAFDAFFFPVSASGRDDPRPSAPPEETGINHNHQARSGRGREEASPVLDDGASQAAGRLPVAIGESDDD